MEGERGGSCDEHQLLLLLMSEDLLIQILLWLPVISLLRFKAVSKSWCSIIESTFFIQLHHATPLPTSSSSSSKLGSSNILLFLRSRTYGKEEEDEMVNVSTVSGDELVVFENFGKPPLMQEEDQEERSRRRRHYPYRYDEMVGCCDGIICLHDSMNRNITLWNPATKQYRFLPKPSLNNTCFGNPNFLAQEFLRFGIDVKTKDQKLLRITSLTPCPAGSAYERRSVDVYSSSTDSWRRIDDATLSTLVHPDIDIEMNMNNRGYLNGRCFFTAQYRLNNKENKDYFIMPLIRSFDFTEEIFRTIQPPYEPGSKGNTYFDDNLYFIPFGEKLALVDAKREKNPVEGYYYYDTWNFKYDIWVLNEQQHGVEVDYSWTKFYTFGPYRESSPPRCITNNGEFAIIYGWYWLDAPLQVLNLMTGETKHLQCGSKCITDVGAYKPSLIPIGGSTGAADR